MICFTGDSADALWQGARRRFMSGEGVEDFDGRTGRTREMRPVMFELTSPRNRWILSREPLSPAAVLSEVVWIMNGRNDSVFVNYFNNELKKFAGDGPTYYGAYGHRLRFGFGVDQLAAAADALASAPESRQVCLSIWDPRLDMPSPHGIPRSKDIPCNVTSLLKVRNGRLEWTQVMRSNDFWLGLPFNIVQFTTIQEIMAGWLGLDVGTYHHLSDSLHLYGHHEEKLTRAEPLELIPENMDDLSQVDRAQSGQVLGAMAVRVEAMARVGGQPEGWEALRPPDDWPEGYANIFRILLSEGARRAGLSDVSEAALGDCTNPVLVLAQRRWTARMQDAAVKTA